MTRTTILSCIAALLLFLAPADAHAQARAASPPRPLGIVASPGLRALAGAAPSRSEPLGTVMVAWCEDPFGAPTVRLGEWSLHAGRWLSRTVVARVEICPLVFQLAWSQQRLVLALGYDGAGVTELRVFERREGRADLEQTAQETFDCAEAPSLDASAEVIVLASYERRAPWLPAAAPGARVEPPFHALHVRLLEPSTLRVRNARVFFGEHLLRRDPHPEAAGHAVRVEPGSAGRLRVAIAGDTPHEVTVKIPSLTGDVARRSLSPELWPQVGVDAEPLRNISVHGRRVVLRSVTTPGVDDSGPLPWTIRVLP